MSLGRGVPQETTRTTAEELEAGVSDLVLWLGSSNVKKKME